MFPFFAADDTGRGPVLVFRAGIEGRWETLELGRRGEVRARSSFDGSPQGRPLVRRGAGGAARLEWIGEASDASPSTST